MQGVKKMWTSRVEENKRINGGDQMDKNLKAFVKELTDLTLKHRVIVGGCGCCDSPYLMGLDNEKQFDLIAGNLKS